MIGVQPPSRSAQVSGAPRVCRPLKTASERASPRISMRARSAHFSACAGGSGPGGVGPCGPLSDWLRGRSASVVVSAAVWWSCLVWPWRIGSARGRRFDCSGLRVARWVADRRVRALFCVARRCSVLAFSLVTPHRCWSAEVPGLMACKRSGVRIPIAPPGGIHVSPVSMFTFGSDSSAAGSRDLR